MHTNAARQFLEGEIPANLRDHVPISLMAPVQVFFQLLGPGS